MENNYFIFATCKGGKAFLVGCGGSQSRTNETQIPCLYPVGSTIQGGQGTGVRLTRVGGGWSNNCRIKIEKVYFS
jgi:hypothetical protein